jgi:hypothetical protein
MRRLLPELRFLRPGLSNQLRDPSHCDTGSAHYSLQPSTPVAPPP